MSKEYPVNPVDTLVKSGLRSASTKKLIEELKKRELKMSQAQEIVYYVFPMSRWWEDE